FFIIAVQTPGSGIFILLAVGTPSIGSGNLYCQWELSSGSGNALCILFPTDNTVTSESDSYYLSDLSRQFDILDRNRYPVDTSLIHIESRKPPTIDLFDIDSGRISIHHCEY
nr:hypothetical protein [Tanacetum cinerariifolium]